MVSKTGALVVLVSACGVAADSVDTAAEVQAISGARYTLAFDTSRLDRARDSWSVETDLGYRVTVTSGSLTTYGVSLVACSDVVASSWLDVFVASAHAGHGSIADPSTWSDPLTEDLLVAEPVVFGEILFQTEAYCRLHYLVYAATEDTEGASSADLERSMRIEGTVTNPDGHTRELLLDSGLGHGSLMDLPVLGGDGEVLDAVLRRDLGGVFDGIDFDQTSDEDVAWTVLGRLAAVEPQLSLMEGLE